MAWAHTRLYLTYRGYRFLYPPNKYDLIPLPRPRWRPRKTSSAN